MKNLKLRRVTLLSISEKAGKIINFTDNFNIVVGENDTGKSSLLKSIYYAFGAETKMHPLWKKTNPIVIINFEYDSKNFVIIRDKLQIALFDEELNLINCSHSVTKDFAPFFSSFFNFKIDLTDRRNQKGQATPAYCLLPFYIDQDLSWGKNWNSFNNLGQFKSWKNDVVSLHTGIKPSEYYILKTEKNSLNETKKQFEKELEILYMIKQRSSESFQEIPSDISLEDFKEETLKLLKELNELKKGTEITRLELKELYNNKQIIEDQIKIIDSSLKEIKSDYKFCVENLQSEVECPICGAEYENSFSERFSIAKDEDTCIDLLQELSDNLKDIEIKIKNKQEDLLKKNKQELYVEELLTTKKEQITLLDLINGKGRQNLFDILDKQISLIKKDLGNVLTQINDLTKKLKEIESPERKKSITYEYRKNMDSFLQKLNVHNLPEDYYKKIDSKIDESGSDLPRALLGYFFSIINVMNKNNENGTFFPIIIDAPKQQEQDKVNEKVILSFIRDHTPKDSQIILGVVDLDGVEFKNANIINLNKKLQLLDKNEYSACITHYKSLLSKINKTQLDQLSTTNQKTLF